MDRIDIQVDVPAVPYKDLAGGRSAESSETIRHRVVAARNTQLRRFFDEHIYSNAQMGPRHIRKYCVLTPDCEKIMENAVTKLGFSARGYDRILKRNRTRRCATLKICIPQHPVPFGLPRKQHYTSKEVASVLGISSDLLRWRIKIGKYPNPQRGNAGRRLFTIDDIKTLCAT